MSSMPKSPPLTLRRICQIILPVACHHGPIIAWTISLINLQLAKLSTIVKLALQKRDTARNFFLHMIAFTGESVSTVHWTFDQLTHLDKSGESFFVSPVCWAFYSLKSNPRYLTTVLILCMIVLRSEFRRYARNAPR